LPQKARLAKPLMRGCGVSRSTSRGREPGESPLFVRCKPRDLRSTSFVTSPRFRTTAVARRSDGEC